MSDLAARARELSKSRSLQYASSYTSDLLEECADALEAKDAEIASLKADLAARTQERDREAWMHAACLTISETGERWGDEVQPSLAMREVWELRQCRDQLRDDRKDLCEERARLKADLAALRAVVRGLPEYQHRVYECDKFLESGPDWLLRKCTCGADEANAKRLAARKAVGLEG